MKRVNRAIISLKDNIKISLFKDEFDYDDELEYIKIVELSPEENPEDSEFAMGCYEIYLYKQDYNEELAFIEQDIKKTEEEIEELTHSKWNEEESIRFNKEYIEYLQEKKKKLQEAESIDELTIDYCLGKLEIFYNGKWEDVNMETNSKELVFKNLVVRIEKF